MEVPVVSLAGCREFVESAPALNADGCAIDARLEATLGSLRTVCEEVGFFIIVDHEVDQSLLVTQRRNCLDFFSRPPQSLIADMVSGSESRFAWLDYVPGEGPAGGDAWSLGPVEGRGSMPWQPDSEEMRATWLAYYAAMEQLVLTLMRLLALVLELPADTFDDALDSHRSSLRAILYPQISVAELALSGEVVRSPVHTDWGCVTVLLADEDVGGLEIKDRSGVWTAVQPVPGGLVVNLGDLLPFWTAGRWVGTPHRVVARPASRQRRLSVPYFGLINRATVLRPLHGSRGAMPNAAEVEAEKAEGFITAGEFFDNHELYAGSLSADLPRT